MEEKASAAGQGVGRLSTICRVLAQRALTGSRLTDVSAATGLSKSTVHRLLASLVAENLVETDDLSGLYFLSFDMFALGISAGNRFGLVEIARDQLGWLEERTGDTIFLSARSGSEAVCIDRAIGSFPIRVLTLNVGDRRPLGVGAGSLSLLATLDDDAIDTAIAANAAQLKLYSGFSPARLRELVERTRENGYAYNEGAIIPGMQAIGVAVPEPAGPSRVAISIAATSERMDEARRTTLVADLAHAAREIGNRLSRVATMRFTV